MSDVIINVHGEPVRVTMETFVDLLTAAERLAQAVRYLESEEFPASRTIYGILTGNYPAKEENHYGKGISR